MPLEQATTTLVDFAGTQVGTPTDPLRIDPTGTTEQPVSQGTAAAVGGAWPMLVTDGVDTAAVETTAPGAAAPGLVVRVAGTVSTTPTRPANSTIARVNVTTVNTTLAAANTSREGFILFNEGNATVFVKLGATATTTSYTVQLGRNSEFEAPFPVYTGIADGITSAGSADVQVTEVTT